MNKRGLIVILLLLLLVVNVNAVYYVRGNGVGGLFNLFDFGSNIGLGNGTQIVTWYENNSGWFDFFIFLMVFLGLGRAVFGEHFKGAGGKGVYIGIGVFLAFSLLIWEQKSGFSLVGNFGIWALLIFIIILLFFVYKIIYSSSKSFLFALSVTYIAVYILFFIIDRWFGMTGDYWIYDIIDEIYFSTGLDIFSLGGFLFVLAILGVIIGLFIRKKSKD
ncbi:MAG: hypothetical protein NT139_02585 [Candidatus Woesearchaeota archaeon]|nr:hypothetical protein [Candidatus Woesearchaeota archaeon]